MKLDLIYEGAINQPRWKTSLCIYGDCVPSSVKLLAILKVPSDIVDIVSLHRFKKQVSEPIASSLGKYVCWDKNVALSHKIGAILSLHRCRKIFVWFFLSLHRWQKFWRTKLYRFIRFFSQKLCICIALNDTFLSIAAHHCIYYCTSVQWIPHRYHQGVHVKKEL